MLRALASDGLFAEVERGVFDNTPASELLRGDGWTDLARLFGGVWYSSVGELDAGARDAVFPRIFGDDFWSWLAAHPSERAAFDRVMATGVGGARSQQLAALDWRGDETVVDVGGGSGALLRGLLDRVPGCVASCSTCRRPAGARRRSTTDCRLSPAASSSAPRGATSTSSRRSCTTGTISGRRRSYGNPRSRPAHARRLVLDSVVPPGNGPHGSKWLDLLMLTLLGGKERDEEQWRALLSGAGFEPALIEDDLIEARRH